MATVLDTVIIPALKELQVLAEGETPSSEQASDALAKTNELLDDLRAQRLTPPSITRTTWTIVSGTAAYTVGPSGGVNIARPVFIEHVHFIDTSTDPDTEYPLVKLTDDAYASIQQKALTSTIPTSWYYNPTFASDRGTLTFWPVPTSSTLLGAIYVPTAVVEFTAIGNTVLLPPGWKRMLVTNLALALAPQFGVQPHPATIKGASESLATVKRANYRPSDMSFPAGSLIQRDGWWDIRLGGPV